MNFNAQTIDRVLAVVKHHTGPGTYTADHRKSHIVGIMLSGESDHFFAERIVKLKAGDVYFFNQCDRYREVTIEPGDCLSVHYTTVEPIDTESFFYHARNPEPFRKELGRIESLFLKRDGGTLELYQEIYRLLKMILDAFHGPYAPKDQRIALAKAYMDAHFREKDCLPAAVKITGLTERRFQDLFKAAESVAPKRYLVGRRIDYARSLLLVEPLTIREIAESAGFSDQSYFNKVFREYTGKTPAGFRRENR